MSDHNGKKAMSFLGDPRVRTEDLRSHRDHDFSWKLTTCIEWFLSAWHGMQTNQREAWASKLEIFGSESHRHQLIMSGCCTLI